MDLGHYSNMLTRFYYEVSRKGFPGRHFALFLEGRIGSQYVNLSQCTGRELYEIGTVE